MVWMILFHLKLRGSQSTHIKLNDQVQVLVKKKQTPHFMLLFNQSIFSLSRAIYYFNFFSLAFPKWKFIQKGLNSIIQNHKNVPKF
jgi:NhaP-type Na+/H+ and K+/H+ antiporter